MSELRYPMIRQAVAETPWAILPSKMAEITEFLAIKAGGGDISAEDIRERFGGRQDRQPVQTAERIGVVPIHGTISHRIGLLEQASGGASVETIRSHFRSLLNDPEIGAIVLDVDSPGGSVSGIPELAAEIYAARGIKPITAVANTLMASAAYWLASAADEIVVTPSAIVGSIGVIAAHEDQSGFYDKAGVKVSLVAAGKYKAENNPFEALSEEGREEIQKRVDEYYGLFVDAVAQHRGVPADTVRSGYGEGRVAGAREAVSMGMAERIATLEDVIATIPTNTDTDSQTANARLGAVSYEELGQRVAADLDLYAQRTRDRVAYRRVETGRDPLSQAQRARLDDICALTHELEAIRTNLDQPMLADRNRATALRVRRNLRNAEAALLGVAD